MSAIALTARPPGFFSSTTVIAKRTWLKFIRTPQLVVLQAIQGAMFLLIFRYVFGGAISSGNVAYANFLGPGFIATAIIWQGMPFVAGIAEDNEQGFVDRLRSLPIPRSAVLAGRAIADTIAQVWGLVIITGIAFAIGFRLHAPLSNALAAFGLLILFSFVLEWVFITLGLFAGNAQAAQGMAFLLVPFSFICSAFVPVESMPSGLQAFAEYQPITFMIDSVRTLALGAQAEELLGHDASYYVVGALLWSVALLAIFIPFAIARYRSR